MAFIAPLNDDWTNETEVEDIHPAAHNDVAAAINLISTALGTGAHNVESRLSSVESALWTPPPFSKAGPISPVIGRSRAYAPQDTGISYVMISLNTAPVGANAIFDVNINIFDGGSSIFVAKPTILDGENFVVTGLPDISVLNQYDYLTVDVIQSGISGGGTVAGADLDVQVVTI